MATSLIASAQFVTSGGSKSFGSSASEEGYNSIRLSYLPTQIDLNGLEALYGDKSNLNGASFEYIRGINFVKDIPLFLEIGIGGKWSNWTDSYEKEYDMYIYNSNTSLNVASLYIPLNIGYRISLTEDFSIMPYAGLMAQANLAATITDSYEYDYHDQFEDWHDDKKQKDRYDMFDKEEMDGQTLKRFFFGWQVGANVTIKKLQIGINYGTTLGKEIANKWEGKLKNITISIGYKF